MTTQTKRILHVEDDVSLIRLCKRILTSVGYIVDTELDPSGPDQLDYESYDMLIVDWMLPRTDGKQICECARKKGFSGPILLLSSKALEAQDRSAIQNLGVSVMGKPFGPNDLISRVQQAFVETE